MEWATDSQPKNLIFKEFPCAVPTKTTKSISVVFDATPLAVFTNIGPNLVAKQSLKTNLQQLGKLMGLARQVFVVFVGSSMAPFLKNIRRSKYE